MARAMSATKRSILDAALELSATHGISGTTMDDVAVRAGVAKGSLYYNFNSKDRLFEELLTGGMQELNSILRTAKGDLTGQVALQSLVRATLTSIRENLSLAKLMVAELFRTDRQWEQRIFEVRHRSTAIFAEAIEEADPSTSADGASSLMASALFGAVLLAGLEWILFNPDRTEDEVATAVLAVISGRFAV